MTAALAVDRGLLILAVVAAAVLIVTVAVIGFAAAVSHYMARSYRGRHDRDRLDAITRIKQMSDYQTAYDPPPHPDGDPAPLHRERRRR